MVITNIYNNYLNKVIIYDVIHSIGVIFTGYEVMYYE